MTRIQLNTPIEVEEDGRIIKQDYLELSRVTVKDVKQYLSGSFLSKKMEFQDMMLGLQDKYPEPKKDEKESEEDQSKRHTKIGREMGKQFFEIFNDNDIVNMLGALSKLPVKALETIDFFDISDMIGEITPFLLPSQIMTGKSSSGQ